MDVEVLVVPDCPNESSAVELVREAGRLAGVADLSVRVTVVGSDEEAQCRGFVGSPTFLVDGIDPFGVPGGPIGVSCRLYPNDAGLSGVRDITQLRDALSTACASQSSAVGDR